MEQDSAKSMRNYLVALSLTFALLTAPTAIFAAWLGVWFSPTILADLQANRPNGAALPFDLRYNAAFKLRRVAAIEPEIIVIGSSRAGGFTREAFAPSRFYNLAFTAWSVRQTAEELDRAMQASSPRVAIITLDYFMLGDQWEDAMGDRGQIHGEPLRYFKASASHLARTIWQKPWILTDVLRSPFIGTQALISREGFQADGAYRFSAAHIEGAKSLLNANNLVSSFPGGVAMSARQKQALEQLASLTAARHVTLVAIQLPILKDGVDFLDHDEQYHPYAGLWRDFETGATRAWLAQIGVHFFDLGRSQIGQDPANFVDAVHLSPAGMRLVMDELNAEPDFRRLTRSP